MYRASQAHLHAHAGESTSKRENENTISLLSLFFYIWWPSLSPQLTLKSVVCVCHVYFVCVLLPSSLSRFSYPKQKRLPLLACVFLSSTQKGFGIFNLPSLGAQREEREGGGAYR